MRRPGILILLISLMLAGCAALAPPPPQSQPEPRPGVDLLLDDYRRVQALSADDQQREFQAAVTALVQQADNPRRMRVALLMMMPRAPWRDDTQLLRLLGETVAGTGADEAALHELALLLQRLVLERQEALRDEQRIAAETQHRLQNQLAERQRQLDEKRRRVAELEQIVDGLRSIDRDLLKQRQNRR